MINAEEKIFKFINVGEDNFAETFAVDVHFADEFKLFDKFRPTADHPCFP